MVCQKALLWKIHDAGILSVEGVVGMDLIYKQDAKDAVDMALDTIDHVPEWVYDILLNSLDKVPSVEPRKKGKWVGADSQCGIGCPFCGTPVDDFCSSIDYIDLSYEPNFCPNCGADMRQKEDDNV